MPRRRKRAARGAGGRGGDEAGPAPTPLAYLAAELYGNNPRLTAAVKGDSVAMLKVEPAPNTKVYYSRRGERESVGGLWGAALVLEDPDELLDFDDNGRLRIRVLSADELEAFAYKLLRYAQYLRLANALGVARDELGDAYWGAGGGSRRAGRRRSPAGSEEDEAVEEEAGAEEEEVEIA